jgi:hypothetical protein
VVGTPRPPADERHERPGRPASRAPTRGSRAPVGSRRRSRSSSRALSTPRTSDNSGWGRCRNCHRYWGGGFPRQYALVKVYR